jgi:hypothetical protein
LFTSFFLGNAPSCPQCNQPIDLWQQVATWIREQFGFGSAIALAGANQTFTTLHLTPGQVTKIDLTIAGVPSDAEIVSLNLTSEGGVHPLLLHGNDVLRGLGPSFHVFGRPIPLAPGQPSEGRLNISAVWFVRRADDTVVRHLVDAARHYEAKHYDAVVVPANIAAEAAITPVIAAGLARYGTADSREAFLRDGATYAHQLNVLLGVVADLHSVPRIPEEIRSGLNRLRKLRNQVGHSGRCDPQSRDDAARHLSSAIFGVEYASFLSASLAKASASHSN